MSIDKAVFYYMAGWSAGVCGRNHSDLFLADHPDFARGHAAGRSCYLVAERVERERLEREQREEDWLRRAVKSGNDTYVPEAGERIEDTVRMVRALANRSGKAARATFNDSPVLAMPGDGDDTVWVGSDALGRNRS